MIHRTLVGFTRVVCAAAVLASAPGLWAADTSGTDPAGSKIERAKRRVLGESTEREADPIKAAQRALTERGFDPGPVDGTLGPKTHAAVKAFQRDEGLKVTGRLDEATMERLRAGAAKSR